MNCKQDTHRTFLEGLWPFEFSIQRFLIEFIILSFQSALQAIPRQLLGWLLLAISVLHILQRVVLTALLFHHFLSKMKRVYHVRVSLRGVAEYTGLLYSFLFKCLSFLISLQRKISCFWCNTSCDFKVEAFKCDRIIPENLLRARLQLGVLGEKEVVVAHEKMKS